MAIGIFIKNRDMGSVVADMQARVAKNVKLPPVGYAINWSGDFENQERASRCGCSAFRCRCRRRLALLRCRARRCSMAW